ncbi:hypothetical protein KZX45_08325 [Georgenia sp. EYE_87]|uniref:hypothetical protein n=1 Tax=Georgenia sp. EYE_87 TaxID=2853448 RepID=UPI002004C5D1|nr:hypothetical protein [Georgenia sp. EYE_87]MCK6210547.1 hypothetical protein [Georgenia sp. EYE_87]
MTYREESAQLAQHLTHLSTSLGSRYLDEVGLAVALMGRHEAIRLMQESMAVATGQDHGKRSKSPDVVSRVTLGEVMNHPVEALRQAIESYPLTPTQQSFLDVRAERLSSATAGIWRNVARSAIIARHDLAAERSAFGPHHRWSLVADVAAMTPVVQNLDRQLLISARRVHPDGEGADRVARALAEAERSPASLLAVEADAISRAGALPDLSGLRVPPSSTRPLAVTSTAALLEAQRRIPAQLEHAEEIRPDVIARTALGQARILLTSAALLEPRQHGRSVELARSLATRIGQEVRPESRDVSALVLGDTTPLVQTTLMWQYLREQRPGTLALRGPDAIALRGLIHHGPFVVEQLARAANKQLSSGRWLISYSDAGTYAWNRYNFLDDAPRLVTALHSLRAAYPTNEHGRAPRAQLNSARTTLGHRTTRRTREQRPATPDLAVGPSLSNTPHRSVVAP